MFNPLAVIVAPRAFLRAFAALENLKLDARLSSVACVSLELSIAHTRALGVTDIVRGVSTPVPVARVARARPCAADRARGTLYPQSAPPKAARDGRAARDDARRLSRAGDARVWSRTRARDGRTAGSVAGAARARPRRRAKRGRGEGTGADVDGTGDDARRWRTRTRWTRRVDVDRVVRRRGVRGDREIGVRDGARGERVRGAGRGERGEIRRKRRRAYWAVWDDVDRAIGSGEERDDV